MMRTLLLATASAVAMAGAFAGAAKADDAAVLERLDAMQKQLEAQQQEMAAQKAEIERLRAALKPSKGKPKKLAVEAPPAPLPADVATRAELDALRAQVDQQATRAQLEKQEQPVWSVVNLRPTVQSPDGAVLAVAAQRDPVGHGELFSGRSGRAQRRLPPRVGRHGSA